MCMTPKQEIERKAELTTAHHDHGKGLLARAFFKMGNYAMSEDLVQETFIKVWKYLVRGGKIEAIRAFLYHILNCLIVDEYRKHKTASLDVLIEDGFEPSVDHRVSLFNFLDGKKAIFLIGELSEKYQKVMRMRYVRGLSLTEMSLITGQTKNTMAVQTYRGLAKLKLLYNRA